MKYSKLYLREIQLPERWSWTFFVRKGENKAQEDLYFFHHIRSGHTIACTEEQIDSGEYYLKIITDDSEPYEHIIKSMK